MLDRLYRFHQLAKFGPSEQLILRSRLLSEIEDKELNALITRRELLIEKLYFSGERLSSLNVEYEELNKLNSKLELFSYPKPDMSKYLIDLDDVFETLAASDLFIDYRHNQETNQIEVFLISQDRVEVKIIDDAASIRRDVYAFKKKISALDPTYFHEGQELYFRLLKPTLKTSMKGFLFHLLAFSLTCRFLH